MVRSKPRITSHEPRAQIVVKLVFAAVLGFAIINSMKIKLLLTAVVCAAFAGMTSGAPVPENVPELMKTFGGEKVESLEQWEKVRAPEIVERFRHEVFGVRPKEAEDRSRVSFEVTDTRDAMDGKAMRKMVTVKFAAPKGEFLVYEGPHWWGQTGGVNIFMLYY